MATDESCALNPDGTLKEANEIQWHYSPTQESLQLPSTQPNCHGPMVQVFSVNAQPATPHTSNQLSSQSVVGKKAKKKKPGKVEGEARVKKRAENEGLGVQRILTDGSTRLGESLVEY